MPALYLWDFAINFYFKCSSVCSQKFKGYETDITFFFTLKHWTKTHAWKCLIKWIMSKGRKRGCMILIHTWQKKIRLKSRIISWWGVLLTSGKIEKICTFNFWGSWLCMILPWTFGSWYVYSLEDFHVIFMLEFLKDKTKFSKLKNSGFTWLPLSIFYMLLGKKRKWTLAGGLGGKKLSVEAMILSLFRLVGTDRNCVEIIVFFVWSCKSD